MAALNDMEKKLAEYKCDTNEAICLKLVRFPEDVHEESTTFHPEFSHQLFGDDEVAFGYKGLQIQLYYSAGNLNTLFKVKYTSRVTEKFDCVQPDDVEVKIREIIPAGFCCSTDDFISLLEKEGNFRPFGSLQHTYRVHNEEAGEDLTYQIHKVDISCQGFREYHERLQTFLMWFIETASFIDVDDDRWDFFLVGSEGDSACVFFAPAPIKTDNGQKDWSDVKRLDAWLSAPSCSAPIKCIMHSVSPAGAAAGDRPSAACPHGRQGAKGHRFEKYNKDGETLYATVGYMTVYNYYVYPDKTRPRVSQMLILPPFQGEGHGAQLLETVHRYYCTSPKVQDITAEDPSENYVKLRDFVLVKLCLNLSSFSVEKLSQGFSEEMASEARDKLKINKVKADFLNPFDCHRFEKKHARRVYEILRLRHTDMSDAEKAREFRLEVKKRLFGPYRKNQRELAKMRKCLRPEELASHISQMDTTLQHEELEKSYQDTLADYRRVLERLAQV
ncbi:hypothetical protein DNTS_011812 [Danionella cerebrum]|nr:hypothetical protein DNTS_011812 [Danionella translucida]